MIGRLKHAATEGLLIAVKWGIVILGVSLVVSAILSDYAQTRAKATAAIDWIQQQQQAAQQKAPSPKQ